MIGSLHERKNPLKYIILVEDQQRIKTKDEEKDFIPTGLKMQRAVTRQTPLPAQNCVIFLYVHSTVL